MRKESSFRSTFPLNAANPHLSSASTAACFYPRGPMLPGAVRQEEHMARAAAAFVWRLIPGMPASILSIAVTKYLQVPPLPPTARAAAASAADRCAGAGARRAS